MFRRPARKRKKRRRSLWPFWLLMLLLLLLLLLWWLLRQAPPRIVFVPTQTPLPTVTVLPITSTPRPTSFVSCFETYQDPAGSEPVISLSNDGMYRLEVIAAIFRSDETRVRKDSIRLRHGTDCEAAGVDYPAGAIEFVDWGYTQEQAYYLLNPWFTNGFGFGVIWSEGSRTHYVYLGDDIPDEWNPQLDVDCAMCRDFDVEIVQWCSEFVVLLGAPDGWYLFDISNPGKWWEKVNRMDTPSCEV